MTTAIDTIKAITPIGLSFLPGGAAGAAIATAIFELHDRLTAAKPPGVTSEQWRGILTGQIHEGDVVDKILSEARKRAADLALAR